MHSLFYMHMPSLMQIGIFVVGVLFGCFVNQFFADSRLHTMTRVHWKLWREEERNRQRMEEEVASMRTALWSQNLPQREERLAASVDASRTATHQ
jgi:hypothetical protein